MINTSISSNTPKSEYLILISSGFNVSSSIINSNISSNVLNSGNIIYLFSSEILIKDCLFISNRGLSSAIQGIYIIKSVLNIEGSRFSLKLLSILELLFMPLPSPNYSRKTRILKTVAVGSEIFIAMTWKKKSLAVLFQETKVEIFL